NYELYKKLKPSPKAAAEAARREAAGAPKAKATRLGYLEQRELEGIEPAIERAEIRKSALEAELAAPENFSNAGKLHALGAELEKLRAEIDSLYARWQQLDA